MRSAAAACSSSVRPAYQEVPGGRIVIFEVTERSTVQKILYVGNESVRKKVLENQTKIKEGDAMDPSRMEEARKAIEDFYHSRGYPKCRVTLLEGGKSTDTQVVFLVNEGRKQKVLWVDFIGNDFVDDARLRTQIKTAHPFMWLFKGDVDRKEIDEDVKRLTAYYSSFGFFDAKIGRVLKFDEKQKWLTLTFVIDEGQQYFVRNVQILGNSKIPTEKLPANLKLNGRPEVQPGETRLRRQEQNPGRVWQRGLRLRRRAGRNPLPFDQPRQADSSTRSKEGDRYTVGRVNVAIKGEYPHTRLSAVLNRVTLAAGRHRRHPQNPRQRAALEGLADVPQQPDGRRGAEDRLPSAGERGQGHGHRRPAETQAEPPRAEPRAGRPGIRYRDPRDARSADATPGRTAAQLDARRTPRRANAFAGRVRGTTTPRGLQPPAAGRSVSPPTARAGIA